MTTATRGILVEALSHVADPTGELKRQVIYEQEPETASNSFDGFPYAYLGDYGVTTERETMNGNVNTLTTTATIVIDSVADSAKKKRQHDELGDEIFSVFKHNERLELGEEAKATDIEIENDSRNTTLVQSGKEVIRRQISISYSMLVAL